MKNFYFIFVFIFIFFGCSSKELPIRDISNTKMALVKADNQVVKKYAPKMLENVKRKYKVLQKLINDERYEDAKYLSQKIQADIRVLEKKALLKSVEDELKTKKGEVNMLNHEFTHIQEGE
jgi:predicted outer membrane protein